MSKGSRDTHTQTHVEACARCARCSRHCGVIDDPHNTHSLFSLSVSLSRVRALSLSLPLSFSLFLSLPLYSSLFLSLHLSSSLFLSTAPLIHTNSQGSVRRVTERYIYHKTCPITLLLCLSMCISISISISIRSRGSVCRVTGR